MDLNKLKNMLYETLEHNKYNEFLELFNKKEYMKMYAISHVNLEKYKMLFFESLDADFCDINAANLFYKAYKIHKFIIELQIHDINITEYEEL